ncbi:MAG TPA: fused MFS/spermidine synthase [Verrucomicrobiae bacterium]|nr:fused MFS/spermidine synthase [Verrucomicrobiae bacterium]
MLPYALTIFTGALLLFEVQPIIGKYILPWFGGAPAVWTTCLLFFQLLLLGGYAYAHFSIRFLKPRHQVALHVALLLGALALLPITPSEAWKPTGSSLPVAHIMALLAASIGLPYLVLSSTGPLLQAWFRRTHPGRSPYRFYALSNIGSLLALLAYPFCIEVYLSRGTQTLLWSWGMVIFALMSAWVAARVWAVRHAPDADDPPPGQQDTARPAPGKILLWLLLPACASATLMATTNKLCQDMAVTPFLWVVPLAIYLLTFVLCFDNPRWYSRVCFGAALPPAIAAVAWAMFEGVDLSIAKQVAIHCAALFVCCMVCHGELYGLRPHPRHLTAYYLAIALGGAIGGVLVAAVAPLVFTTYEELNWALVLGLLLLLVVCISDRDGLDAWRWFAFALLCLAMGMVGLDRGAAMAIGWWKSHHQQFPSLAWLAPTWKGFASLHWAPGALIAALACVGHFRGFFDTPRACHRLTCGFLAAALVAAAITFAKSASSGGTIVAAARNFYGVLKVREYNRGNPDTHYFLLEHGRITHGLQFTSPMLANQPTTYYMERSGINIAFRLMPAHDGSRHIGVLGLGTGSIASLGLPGDRFRFYEINPEISRIASTMFSCLSKSRAKTEIVLGDARLSLEREAPQNFDILVMDAFSSDAVPIHLLTKEAFEIYLRHMRQGGVIAVHISNRFLDLRPVVANVASHFKLNSATISTWEDEDVEWWDYESTWVLLTRDDKFMNLPTIRAAASKPDDKPPRIPLWTDDWASLFPILE